MRFLHTSDWHLGRALHGEELTPHHASFLAWLLGAARDEGAQAVVVAGDVYDRSIPPVDAVGLLDETFRRFAEARIPLIVTSGNHDSPVRLGFGAGLARLGGVHLRTTVDAIAEPIVLGDEWGKVAFYGMPYLQPDEVRDALGAERSHASVLGHGAARARAHALRAGFDRTVLIGHAMVTGGATCESERDLHVGGVADAPASSLDGFSYVALGHLHRAQAVAATGGSGTLRYSGSPLAYSFAERDHEKSVAVVEIDGRGDARCRLVPTPVPRPLREVRGPLEELLARAAHDLASLAEAWVHVVLTDPRPPAAPMDRLRAVWPHTLQLSYAPESALPETTTDLGRLARATSPVEVCELFVEFVTGHPPSEVERTVLTAAVERATHAEEPG
ncbi:MAG: exonuclease SbcCD subunit D [Polyangiaceae bacterium]|nr:exonuclease SbcCD subunit D [Polyangiaceae bacterium]